MLRPAIGPGLVTDDGEAARPLRLVEDGPELVETACDQIA
jgi:hypothetical protein